mmetsp:Transcript_4966/g.7701  ORF Transcript_4966/g.7701 Transcript_4966/m.7701 type:complete len:103 (-) Transcript_4966:22-330(-)
MMYFAYTVLALLASIHEASSASIILSSEHFNQAQYVENQIITSLNNCPLCKGKEPCLMDCKQKENKSWNECLNRCLGDNPLLLETFQSIVRSSAGELKSFGK